MTFKNPAHRGGPRRGRFEQLAGHAIRRKLDAIAGAPLEAHGDERGRACEDLRNAIRMEEET
ncbi:hypothetical protein ACWCPJ_08160 [Streptomyces collinus]